DEQALPVTRLDSFDMPVLDRYRGNTRPNLRREVAVAEANALYSRRFAIAQALSPRLLPSCDDHKRPFVWPANLPFDDGEPSPQQGAEGLALAHKEYSRYLRDYQPGRCEALRELLTACREADVPAALVVLPEGPVFRDWYAPGVWPRVQGWLDDIGREY